MARRSLVDTIAPQLVIACNTHSLSHPESPPDVLCSLRYIEAVGALATAAAPHKPAGQDFRPRITFGRDA